MIDSSQQGTTMDSATALAIVSKSLGRAERTRLDFIPGSLKGQCRYLIESYHGLHGYACLPDILWRTRLSHLIETHRDFRQLLKKASTTRSAKKSNEGFVTIAAAILSLEILASDFSGWSTMFPDAKLAAIRILDCRAGGSNTSLMEQYLYPPKYINPAVIAALVPPPLRVTDPKDMYQVSAPETAGEKIALGGASSVRDMMLRDMKRSVLASADQA